MLMVVVVMFLVSWLPMQTFCLVFYLKPELRANIDYHSLKYNIFVGTCFAFHWLSMAHSSFNPLIYCFMNDKFRSDLNHLFRGKRSKAALLDGHSTNASQLNYSRSSRKHSSSQHNISCHLSNETGRGFHATRRASMAESTRNWPERRPRAASGQFGPTTEDERNGSNGIIRGLGPRRASVNNSSADRPVEWSQSGRQEEAANHQAPPVCPDKMLSLASKLAASHPNCWPRWKDGRVMGHNKPEGEVVFVKVLEQESSENGADASSSLCGHPYNSFLAPNTDKSPSGHERGRFIGRSDIVGTLAEGEKEKGGLGASRERQVAERKLTANQVAAV